MERVCRLQVEPDRRRAGQHDFPPLAGECDDLRDVIREIRELGGLAVYGLKIDDDRITHRRCTWGRRSEPDSPGCGRTEIAAPRRAPQPRLPHREPFGPR